MRVTTDSSGNKLGEQGHYPYGEAWYAASTTTKWQFTSYERDAESGNDYAMARYDVNRLGRFSSADPLVGTLDDPQTLNRYAYVRGNPISLVDPSGQEYFTAGGCTYYREYASTSIGDGTPVPQGYTDFLVGCDFGGGGTGAGERGGTGGGGGGTDGGGGGSTGTTTTTTCAQPTGPSKIYNVSATTSAPTKALGASVGGLIGGPPGAVVGSAIGNLFGIGVNGSYVPSTGSIYLGPTAVVGLSGGTGVSGNICKCSQHAKSKLDRTRA